MTKNKKESIKPVADKVDLKSKRKGISSENQNQNHNTQKEALGPNTKRQGGSEMGKSNKMKSTKNKNKEDGTFRSKKVKHDPQAESARAVFGVEEKKQKFNSEKQYCPEK